VSLDFFKVRLEINWQLRYAGLRIFVVDAGRREMKVAKKG
jgi:hypothetical protein